MIFKVVLQYFNKTNSAKILSKFSKDIPSLDFNMFMQIDDTISNFMLFFALSIAIVLLRPILIIPSIIELLILFKTLFFFKKSI